MKQRHINNFVATLAVSLIAASCLSSCGKREEMMIIEIPEPFNSIRSAYYRHFYLEKGETTEKTSTLFRKVIYETEVPDRPINESSFYILDYYGVFDGYYVVDFLVNGHGPSGPNMTDLIEFEGEFISLRTRFHPVFYKDGEIFLLEEMEWKGTGFKEVGPSSGIRYYKQIADKEDLTAEEVFAEPTLGIKYRWEEYMENLRETVYA